MKTEEIDKKAYKYYELLTDQKKLIQSSKSIITKKLSPTARKINKGDVKTIIKVSKDRIYGSLTKNKHDKLCLIFCDLKNKLKKLTGSDDKTSEGRRSAIIFAICQIITHKIDAACGGMIQLLWLIRHSLYELICKCQFNITNTCVRHV